MGVRVPPPPVRVSSTLWMLGTFRIEQQRRAGPDGPQTKANHLNSRNINITSSTHPGPGDRCSWTISNNSLMTVEEIFGYQEFAQPDHTWIQAGPQLELHPAAVWVIFAGVLTLRHMPSIHL